MESSIQKKNKCYLNAKLSIFKCDCIYNIFKATLFRAIQTVCREGLNIGKFLQTLSYYIVHIEQVILLLVHVNIYQLANNESSNS